MGSRGIPFHLSVEDALLKAKEVVKTLGLACEPYRYEPGYRCKLSFLLAGRYQRALTILAICTYHNENLCFKKLEGDICSGFREKGGKALEVPRVIRSFPRRSPPQELF